MTLLQTKLQRIASTSRPAWLCRQLWRSHLGCGQSRRQLRLQFALEARFCRRSLCRGVGQSVRLSSMSIYSIHRDAMAAMRSLTAIVRGLMLRGDSLKSLSEKSDELLISSILFEERAERVHQQLLAEHRTFLSMSRVRVMRCCVCLLCVASVTFMGLVYTTNDE
jgi:hypothetical protein